MKTITFKTLNPFFLSTKQPLRNWFYLISNLPILLPFFASLSNVWNSSYWPGKVPRFLKWNWNFRNTITWIDKLFRIVMIVSRTVIISGIRHITWIMRDTWRSTCNGCDWMEAVFNPAGHKNWVIHGCLDSEIFRYSIFPCKYKINRCTFSVGTLH